MDLPNSSVLFDLFHESSLKNSKKTALILEKEDVISTATYGDISEVSSIISDVLIKENICQGKCIGVISTPSLQTPAIIIGILKVSACFVPIDINNPSSADLNQQFITKLNIRHVISSMGKAIERFTKGLENYFHFEYMDSPKLAAYQLVLIEVSSSEHLSTYQNEGVAYAMCTSGTTGTPKIVRVPLRCIVPNIISLREIFRVTSDDVIFMASPLTFDPSIVEMFLALSTGATLLMVSIAIKMRPRKLAQTLKNNKVTILQATPTLVSRFGPSLLKSTILRKDSSLRVLVFGGEQCPTPAVLSDWRANGNQTEVFNIYGITEVSSWATLYQIPEEDIRKSNKDSVPLGETLLGTILEVRDDRGQPVTSGEGQLFLGGEERVCLLDDECSVVPGKLRATGDIVRFASNGLVHVGRMDHQIKKHGQRINLLQVKELIDSNSLISTSCLIQSPDNGRLILFAVPNTNLNEATRLDNERALFHELLRTLPHNASPDQVCFVAKLPVTSHFKVDTHQLLKHMKLVNPASSTGQMSDSVHRQLWQKILKVDKTIEDSNNFILCGGDSFQAIMLSDQIEQLLKQSIPDLQDYILHRTYFEVSQLIKEHIETFSEENTSGRWLPEDHASVQTAGQDCLPLGLTKNIQNLDSERTDSSIAGELKDDTTHLNTVLHGMDCKRKRASDMSGNDSTKMFRPDGTSDASSVMASTLNTPDTSTLNTPDTSTLNTPDTSTLFSIRRGSQFLHHGEKYETVKNDERRLKTHKGSMISFEEKWRCDTGKCIDASPLVVSYCCSTEGEDAIVYIGSHSHQFMAVSIATGLPIWTTMLADRVESSACLSKCGNYIIVGCYDHNVYILSANTGAIVWSMKTAGPVKSSPVIHPQTGTVYVGSHDQNLHALDIVNQICMYSTFCGGGSVYSSPCINTATGTIYIGTLSGKLTCIDLSSGSVLWTHNVGKPIFSSPAITAEGIVVGCVDNHLYHISLTNHMIWSFKTDGPVFSSPCVPHDLTSANTLAVFGSHDSCIYCVNIATGKQHWKFITPSPVYATPFIFKSDCLNVNGNDQFVVCGCTQGSLFIIELITGKLIKYWILKGEVFSSPVVHGNSVIVGCRDNNIYNLQFG